MLCCVHNHNTLSIYLAQVLSGLAAMSDSDLDAASRGDKRQQEAAAANLAVRKEALGCCLQVGCWWQDS